MNERTGVITFKGNGMTLVGNAVAVGQAAPDATMTANDMSTVKISDYAGKVLIISAVPSLDTPVCDTQTRRFNDEAGKLGDGVAVLTVSLDLPFAQRRWCGAAGATHVKVVSDYKERAFGNAFGLLIKELCLLSRAVIVVDRSGKIAHMEIVKEVTQEPDYAAALAAAAKAG